MGSLFSIFNSNKDDMINIEQIQEDLTQLNLKIGRQEVKIDTYVKNQIVHALNAYDAQIDQNLKKKLVSAKRGFGVKDLIHLTANKVQHLKSKEHCSKHENEVEEDVKSIKDYLSMIARQIEKDDINVDEDLLEKVKVYTRMLAKKSSLQPNEKDTISILFLKLFLKFTPTKICIILKENMKHVDKSIENFDRINMENIDILDAEEAEKDLKVINSKLRTINKLSREGFNEVREKCGKPTGSHKYPNKNRNGNSRYGNSSDGKLEKYYPKNDILLNSMNDDLEEYTKILNTFYPPVDEKSIISLKTQIDDLLKNRLNKLNGELPEIKEKKNILKNKGQQMLEKLKTINELSKEINEHLKFLKEIEKKMYSILGSQIPFQKKKEIFKNCLDKVNVVNGNHTEVYNRKMQVLNRINCVFLREKSNYLEQFCKIVIRHNLQVQQFPFPKRNRRYEIKRKEIDSLLNDLEKFREKYPFFDERIDFIKQNISKVQNALAKKADNNENTIIALEKLEELKKEVADIISSSRIQVAEKLAKLNECRRSLSSIDDYIDKRVIVKKMDIYYILHNYEENVFPNFPMCLQKLKTILNKYENELQEDIHLTSVKDYAKKREEILTLTQLKDFNKMITDNYLTENFATKVIQESIEIILTFLDQNEKKKEEINRFMKYLTEIDQYVTNLFKKKMLSSEDIAWLQMQEIEMKKVQKSTNSEPILDRMRNIEEAIITLKSNNFIKTFNFELFKKEMTVLVSSVPQNIFKQNIINILSLKGKIEDMPQGDPELDAEKQVFLQKTRACLQTMDEHLVEIIFKQTKAEPILELQSSFDFEIKASDFSVNSVEFIRKIRERTATFEDDVKNYLGTNDSVEYYVIHENLMRLLEELDKQACGTDEIFLGELVEAVDYIKSLINLLKLNSSSY